MPHQDALQQFSRHTPRILRRQIILQLAEQYLTSDKPGKRSPKNESHLSKPSIQRFHGALLFVDISGFTALSLKLNVEELKNHINEYFTKMLDIVDKHDGDVIKFAGDALFIIWEVHETPLDSSWDFTKAAVEKAVECGREINESCGNHKVVINRGSPVRHMSGQELSVSVSSNSSSLASLPSMGNMTDNFSLPSSNLLTPLNSVRNLGEEEAAYLNVHSGVSVGLMAGIDIGADNRWEYFLIGEPLSKVAEAEGQASSGDIIMCPESHSVLHQDVSTPSNFMGTLRRFFLRETPVRALPCGCTPMKNGYCKVNASQTVLEKKKSRRTNKSLSPKDGHQSLEVMRSDIREVYTAQQAHFMKEFLKKSKHARMPEQSSDATETKLLASFCQWAEICLTDDVARHVHAVLRSEYSFSDTLRIGAYQRHIDELSKVPKMSAVTVTNDFFNFDDAPSISSSSLARNSPLLAPLRNLPGLNGSPCNSPGPSRHSSPVVSRVSSPTPSRIADRIARAQDFSPARFNPDSPSPGTASEPASRSNSVCDVGYLSDASQSVSISSGSGGVLRTPASQNSMLSSSRNAVRRTNGLLRSSFNTPTKPTLSSAMIAEIRTVTVMFVKILMPPAELVVDSTKRAKSGGGFRFLPRTLNEKVADQLLLDRFQTSIEVLSECFCSHGGQMRQFIVDDKGTVCIGTFGLKGSVSDDNAAAALEAAHVIVVKLQALGLQCSIGVTVGRAYCGLVGSSNRHEYAVMGPSTNLSARLMCKAPAYGVICDLETRTRDRTHGFVPLADIVAKGYSSPVGTFKPVFPEVEAIIGVPNELSAILKGVSTRLQSVDEHSVRSTSSNTDSRNLKIIDRLIGAKSAMYFRDKQNVKCRLHGRGDEICSAINFLFSELVDPGTCDGRSPINRSLFDFNQPSVFVGIGGAHGIGKSCLVMSIAEQVATVVKVNHSCNIQVFRTRYDRFYMGVPFVAWKPIIQEMIIRIFRNQSCTPKRKKSFGVGLSVSSVELNDAVAYVLTRLPSKFRHLQALFGYLAIITQDNIAISELNLSAHDKLLTCIELLTAVIQLYTLVTKQVVFITMDDIQAFDEASLLLLLEVYVESTGVVVLFTGRSMGSHKNNGLFKDSTLEGGKALVEFLTTLKSAERFHHIELEGLDKDATTSLVKDAMSLFRATYVEENLYDKIFDVSGGNPFYAFEITKSLSERSGGLPVDRFALHSVRIEEVICHRFDQLKNSAQSLLKMAAVACSHGSSFTLAMLADIGDGEMSAMSPNNSNIDMNEYRDLPIHVRLALILQSVLRSESFICVADVNEKADVPHEISVEMLLANNYSFEFNVQLEQSTIYNLLLDDQKHAIHEGIAEYYRNRRELNSTKNTVDCYREEGFHWQSACSLANAMLCYYEASRHEEDATKKGEFLDMAFGMYQALKDTTELYPDPRGISFLNLQQLTEDTFKNEGKSRAELDLNHTMSLTLERVFQIFDGDSAMLETGLTVLIEVCLQRVRRFEDSHGTQLILEDALQMILLTKNPFLMSSKYLAKLMNSVMDVETSYEDLNPNEMHFCLYDSFSHFCLRAFSTYLMNYVRSTSVASDYSRKVAYIAAQYLSLARSEESAIDTIQALCMNALIQNKLSNLKQSLQMVDELRAMYVFETHSQQLIDLYGADQVIYLLTRTSKYVLLAGDRDKAQDMLNCCIQYIMGTTDMSSLTSSVFRIISVLAYAERHCDAHEVLARFDRVMRVNKTHKKEQVSWKILHLYYEWLSRRIKHSTHAQNHRNVKILTQETFDVDDMVKNVEQLMRSEQDKKFDQGVTFAVHYRHEICIVLADICYLKADNEVQGAKEATLLMDICKTCCGHLKAVMDVTIVDPRDLFNKACAVKVAIQITNRVSPLLLEECLREFRSTFSASVLAEMKKESQISQLHALGADLALLQQLLYEK